MIKSYAMPKAMYWLVFALIGALFASWGLHQTFVVPTYDDHWAWLLTGDSGIWDYIKFRFQNQGVWTAANGAFILLVAVTGYRNREPWAWWTLALVPVYIGLLTTLFYWLFFITIPLLLAAIWSLWMSRMDLIARPPYRSSPGWLLLFAVGLGGLCFAYDNFFVIPALDVHDPERGWAWLTTNSEVIDYFRLHSRGFGIHVFGLAMLTILTTVNGLRQGYRWAWAALWLALVLPLVHLLLWPSLAPLLIGVAVPVGLGLWWAYPRAGGVVNA